jgi:hypothetical protein
MKVALKFAIALLAIGLVAKLSAQGKHGSVLPVATEQESKGQPSRKRLERLRMKIEKEAGASEFVSETWRAGMAYDSVTKVNVRLSHLPPFGFEVGPITISSTV